MGKWLHRLSEVDLEKKTAVCLNCGPVKIKKHPSDRWPKCAVATSKRKSKSRYRKANDNRPSSCEICGSDKRICYDHDHKTGKFRGWICNSCNVALGCVDDNIEVLKKMIEYLKH